MSFESAHPTLARALAAREYATPTAVQSAVLADDARDHDLLVSAQTGSGKTVAFGLALAPVLLGTAAKLPPAKLPLALIIAPTRELAIQVHKELTWLYADAGARIATCVGGMDPRREQHALAHGVHIVVGTPGRLCDHVERGALQLGDIRAVVLDEADEMLDMGFRDELERLLDKTPATRRTLMFSATIPRDIASLAKRYQKDAQRIATSSDSDQHRDIEYRAVPILPRERDLAVVNVLRYFDVPGALVFCSTRDGVTHLCNTLAERRFSSVALSGELSQRERNYALQAVRDGRARVCVATDVAARGLDLPDLGLVVHADIPQNKQILLHRSGRTGRAGKHGVSVVLVPEPARRHVERMLASAHIEATWALAPSADDIRANDGAALVREIAALAADVTDDDRAVAKALLAERSAEELAATLVRVRREARPAPEELDHPGRRCGRGAHRRRRRRIAIGRWRPTIARRFTRLAATPAAVASGPSAASGPSVTIARRGPHSRRPTARPRTFPASVRIAGAGASRAPVSTHTISARPDRSRDPLPDGSAMTWFTVNVGRSKNADPKWLIPLLCRRGDITKREIGKIRVLVRETHVEIARAASEHFATAIQRPDEQDRNIRIELLDSADHAAE